MTPVATVVSALKYWADDFDEASELAFNQGNSGLYAKYSEVATQLRECADNLGDVPAIRLQSSTESVTVSHQNDISFTHYLRRLSMSEQQMTYEEYVDSLLKGPDYWRTFYLPLQVKERRLTWNGIDFMAGWAEYQSRTITEEEGK